MKKKPLKEIRRFKLYTDEYEHLAATVAPPPYCHTRLYEFQGKHFIIVQDQGPFFEDPPEYSLYEVFIPHGIDAADYVFTESTETEQLAVEGGLVFSRGESWEHASKKATKAAMKIYSENGID